MNYHESQKLHEDIAFLGLRAQATAVGLVQLSIELQRAGVLSQDAICRVKGAIADNLTLKTPSYLTAKEHRCEVAQRLDKLFSGQATLPELDEKAAA